jgi:methyltransferase-like protein/2-polyprenyl-3-methyl-5-hydroxy-6-metoxy-1,4-benzoquinol methylase
VPYLSYAIRQTHVSSLEVLGRVFGLQPADCRRCRVLEIGGASGGNLLPMAAALPQSEFVCLDPAARQIEEGRRHAAAAGVKNLSFRAETIEALGQKERFDYIICHGVFSWVRQPVQDAIFRALQACLAPNGIAFISYKTLPGWHAYRALREVLIRHSARESTPQGKALRAREMLALLETAAQEPRSKWGPHLLAEIRELRTSEDSYLLHDQLEDHNEAFYFADFMARAHRHGLQYLGEADVHTMYIGNVPPGIPREVALGDDIEAIEQYIDFALNRLFRQTILCRDSVALNRMAVREAVDGCYIQSFLVPESRDTFRGPGGLGMTTADPIARETLELLARHSHFPVSAEAAVAELLRRLPNADATAARATFRRIVLQAFFATGIRLFPIAPAYVAVPSARPQAIASVRYEASYRPAVTNGRHEPLMLNEFERRLMLKLDGTRELSELVRDLGEEVRPALERFAANAFLCA